MNALSNLPVAFWLLITGMTVYWHVKNWPAISTSASKPQREAYVNLVTAHAFAIVSLFLVATGKQPWGVPIVQYTLGLLPFVMGMAFKVRAATALPDNLWHFTERNRQLVAEGRIIRFHLENDVAALLPLLILVGLAHRFG
jgi:hypothetical protein